MNPLGDRQNRGPTAAPLKPCSPLPSHSSLSSAPKESFGDASGREVMASSLIFSESNEVLAILLNMLETVLLCLFSPFYKSLSSVCHCVAVTGGKRLAYDFGALQGTQCINPVNHYKPLL